MYRSEKKSGSQWQRVGTTGEKQEKITFMDCHDCPFG